MYTGLVLQQHSIAVSVSFNARTQSVSVTGRDLEMPPLTLIVFMRRQLLVKSAHLINLSQNGRFRYPATQDLTVRYRPHFGRLVFTLFVGEIVKLSKFSSGC